MTVRANSYWIKRGGSRCRNHFANRLNCCTYLIIEGFLNVIFPNGKPTIYLVNTLIITIKRISSTFDRLSIPWLFYENIYTYIYILYLPVARYLLSTTARLFSPCQVSCVLQARQDFPGSGLTQSVLLWEERPRKEPRCSTWNKLLTRKRWQYRGNKRWTYFLSEIHEASNQPFHPVTPVGHDSEINVSNFKIDRLLVLEFLN